jgi:hypothetical protein
VREREAILLLHKLIARPVRVVLIVLVSIVNSDHSMSVYGHVLSLGCSRMTCQDYLRVSSFPFISLLQLF